MARNRTALLLKPVTQWAINRGFGLLKRKPADKPFSEEWSEHKRQELKLEEAKHARRAGRSRSRSCG